ncbi:MAG: tetratricopeptide repeat protein [Planctomycetes bacterium]|nr:tetratricopeptide repeat protein [Planctomycetota bacterium]
MSQSRIEPADQRAGQTGLSVPARGNEPWSRRSIPEFVPESEPRRRSRKRCRWSFFGAFLGVACVLAASPATALDIVSRKSSEKNVQGTITQITRDGITVTPRLGKPITIPANDIQSVRWDGEPAKLNLARGDEKSGRVEKALQTYQEILKQIGPGKTNLKRDVEFLIARATARLARTDSSKRDLAIQALEAFLKKASDSFRYYEAVQLLGELYLAKKDFRQAKSAFEQLGRAPWRDFQMAAQSALAQILLAQGKVSEALKTFDAVLQAQAKTPLEKQRRWEAMLGKANCLVQQKQYEPALKLLQDVVREAPAENSRILAEAYVRQGDCLQAMGKPKEAVLAYLHVPVLFPQESQRHAEALYHLSRLWNAVERPERAADARAELESKYPDSPWTKRLTAASSQ